MDANALPALDVFSFVATKKCCVSLRIRHGGRGLLTLCKHLPHLQDSLPRVGKCDVRHSLHIPTNEGSSRVKRDRISLFTQLRFKVTSNIDSQTKMMEY